MDTFTGRVQDAVEDPVQEINCLGKKTRFTLRNDLLLSSGGQDGFIRVWRFSHRSSPDERSLLETAKDDDEDITMKEEIITIEKENIFFAVSLETVLAGHEDKVFSVQWKHG